MLPEDSHTGHAGRELVPWMVVVLWELGHLHHFPRLAAHVKVGDQKVSTKEFVAALVTVAKLETI